MARLCVMVLAVAACLAVGARAHVCPRYGCPRVDTLDFLQTAPPLSVVQDQTLDTPQKCADSCPCSAGYFAWYQAFNPIKYYCLCYSRCVGTFKKTTESGQRGAIRHGYLNCTNTCHDPHFIGAHGTRFDFNGELGKSFCLVSDRQVHLNALFKGYRAESQAGASPTADGHGLRSWMGELGLVWTEAARKHSLRLVARDGKDSARGDGFVRAIAFDGASVSLPSAPGAVLQAGELSLSFLGTFANEWGGEEDKYTLTLGDRLQMALHVGPAVPAWQLPGDALVHFSFSIRHLDASPAVHGVLGQTYRNTAAQLLKAAKYTALGQLLRAPVKADGPTGLGFLDGRVADYISTDILSTDCAMSAMAA